MLLWKSRYIGRLHYNPYRAKQPDATHISRNVGIIMVYKSSWLQSLPSPFPRGRKLIHSTCPWTLAQRERGRNTSCRQLAGRHPRMGATLSVPDPPPAPPPDSKRFGLYHCTWCLYIWNWCLLLLATMFSTLFLFRCLISSLKFIACQR